MIVGRIGGMPSFNTKVANITFALAIVACLAASFVSRGHVQLFLEHAPAHLLRDLIGHCFIMCRVIGCYECGAGSDTDLVDAIQNVISTSLQVSQSVLGAIKCGDLVVRDGVIVNANQEANDE